MPPKKETLTVDALKQLWESKFLPSIRSEFKKEIDHIKRELNSLTQKCNEIEKSQSFLPTEYDNVKTSIQTTKKEVMETAKSLKEVEVKIESADDRIYDQDTRMDNIEQYLRCDCIEITGIPTVSQDNPKQIAVELGEMLGIDVTEHHISIAHCLPPNKKDTKSNYC
jgi:septation ring formation regulator EzrA